MPLSGEAKRAYQRDYMRRQHGYRPRLEHLDAEGGDKGVVRGEFRPILDPLTNSDFRPERAFGDGVTYRPPYQTKDARHLLTFMRLLNARGFTLGLGTEPGTGELLGDVLEELPWVSRCAALEARLDDAMTRITQLEAAQALREAQESPLEQEPQGQEG